MNKKWIHVKSTFSIKLLAFLKLSHQTSLFFLWDLYQKDFVDISSRNLWPGLTFSIASQGEITAYRLISWLDCEALNEDIEISFEFYGWLWLFFLDLHFQIFNNSWIYQNDFWLTGHLLQELPLLFPSSSFCSSSFCSFSTSITTSTITYLPSIRSLPSVQSLQLFRAFRVIYQLRVKLPMFFLLLSLFQLPTRLFLKHSSREPQFKPLFPQYGVQLFQTYLLTKWFILVILAQLLLFMLVSSLFLQFLMFLQAQSPFFQYLSQLKRFSLLDFIFSQFEVIKLPFLSCFTPFFQLQQPSQQELIPLAFIIFFLMFSKGSYRYFFVLMFPLFLLTQLSRALVALTFQPL